MAFERPWPVFLAMCAVAVDAATAPVGVSEAAPGDAEPGQHKRAGGDAAASQPKKHKSLRRQEKEREYYMRQERLKATRKSAPCRHFAAHGKCAHGDACQFTHVRPPGS